MFAKTLMLAAAMLTATAAMAETHKPDAYNQLVAVPMHAGQAPRLLNGVSDLSSREPRHQERLPLQLRGAVKKLERAKYAPKRKQQQSASHSAKTPRFEEALPMPAGKGAVASDAPSGF